MYCRKGNMMIYSSWRLMITALVTILFLLDFGVTELAPDYTFMHEATEAPRVSLFDFIVIGGGTTGIPIATTLSANYSVLLLERGGSPYNDPNITNASNFGLYFFDTSPNSPAQQFTTEGVPNARARVLGGGTSINGGFYSRGEKQFNIEAKLRDEDLIQESYEWTEKVMVFEQVAWNWQSTLRTSLLEAGVTPDNGFTYDHLVGTKVSGTIFDENGTRHTAADLLQYANPEGLSLFLHATVHKILFKHKGRSRPRAYGVVFKDTLGKKHVAYLKGRRKDEIILSVGALGSPQLLMLSGIGPKDQLDALNIKVVLEQPFVGQGMADNPLNVLVIPSPVIVERSILVKVVGITSFGNYIEANGGTNILFANLSVYQGYTYEKGAFIYEKVNGPLSKGDLKIVNRNPSDNPLVTFNYLTEPEDLQKCVKGIETILKTINSEAYSNYKLANMTDQDILDLNMKLPYNMIAHGNTSSSLEQHCKDTVRTIWHYHGGCLIGKVVDDEYKVIGVDSLRVIDGSTLLNSPGTNPQASLLMLGRYMGVTILSQRIAGDKRLPN